MFKTAFDRSPLVITLRLILLLIVLLPLGYLAYSLRNVRLEDRTPALPTPPAARMEPRPTPHTPVRGTIPVIDGKVTSIEFAHAAKDAPLEQFQYGTRFSKSEVWYISAVISFEYPPASQTRQILTHLVVYRDGVRFAEGEEDSTIDQGLTNHRVIYTFGFEIPGYFPPGQYYVEILYDGEVIANGAFEIID